MMQRFPGQTAVDAPDLGHQYLADCKESDMGDPELGAATMAEDEAAGGGDAAGGAA